LGFVSRKVYASVAKAGILASGWFRGPASRMGLAGTGKILRGPALRFGDRFRELREDGLGLDCFANPDQHVVHGLLNTGRRPVKLARGFGHNLTQKIAVVDRIECVINQIGTHDVLLIIEILAGIPGLDISTTLKRPDKQAL
jgi:hypothetical protein